MENGKHTVKDGGPEQMNKLESWKDEDWKLEVEISETKQNEVKRKLEAKIEKK